MEMPSSKKRKLTIGCLILSSGLIVSTIFCGISPMSDSAKPSYYYATASNEMNYSLGCDQQAVLAVMNNAFWVQCLSDLSKKEPEYAKTISPSDMQKCIVYDTNIYFNSYMFLFRYQNSDEKCPIINCISVVCFRIQDKINNKFHYSGQWYVKDKTRIFSFASNKFSIVGVFLGFLSLLPLSYVLITNYSDIKALGDKTKPLVVETGKIHI